MEKTEENYWQSRSSSGGGTVRTDAEPMIALAGAQ